MASLFSLSQTRVRFVFPGHRRVRLARSQTPDFAGAANQCLDFRAVYLHGHDLASRSHSLLTLQAGLRSTGME